MSSAAESHNPQQHNVAPLMDTTLPEADYEQLVRPERGPDELERSLGGAKHLYDAFRHSTGLKEYMAAEKKEYFDRLEAHLSRQQGTEVKVDRTAKTPADRSWRYVSDYAHYVITHSEHQPTREEKMAQLLLSVPDLAHSVMKLPTLIKNYRERGTQFDANVLGYTQERIADFKGLLREVVETYGQDLSAPRLKYELRTALLAAQAITDPKQAEDAQAIINGTVNNMCAELGLETMLRTHPGIQIEPATPTDRINRVAFFANVALDGCPVNESHQVVRVGVDPRFSIASVIKERERAGMAPDDDNPCFVRDDGDVLHATAHCMLTRDDFAKGFKPQSWVVQKFGQPTAEAFIQSIAAAA